MTTTTAERSPSFLLRSAEASGTASRRVLPPRGKRRAERLLAVYAGRSCSRGPWSGRSPVDQIAKVEPSGRPFRKLVGRLHEVEPQGRARGLARVDDQGEGRAAARRLRWRRGRGPRRSRGSPPRSASRPVTRAALVARDRGHEGAHLLGRRGRRLRRQERAEQQRSHHPGRAPSLWRPRHLPKIHYR